MQKRHRNIITALWIAVVIAGLGLAALQWLSKARNATAAAAPNAVAIVQVPEPVVDGPLPVLFPAPTFSLTDQDGNAFGTEQLRGKVWIADFIFTQCTGLCPMMTQRMSQFQQQTPGSPVQMVSFSVDPQHDTPSVFKQYAIAAKADFSRWHFLTGTQKQTWEISRGMKLAVSPGTGDQVMHSPRFLLIDGMGNVRGIYDTGDAEFDLNKLVADAKRLAGKVISP